MVSLINPNNEGVNMFIINIVIICIMFFVGLVMGLSLGGRNKTERRLDEEYNTRLINEIIDLKKQLNQS